MIKFLQHLLGRYMLKAVVERGGCGELDEGYAKNSYANHVPDRPEARRKNHQGDEAQQTGHDPQAMGKAMGEFLSPSVSGYHTIKAAMIDNRREGKSGRRQCSELGELRPSFFIVGQ